MENLYYINYHTGAGNFKFCGTLEQAMAKADEAACYTQENITIEDCNTEKVVAMRRWYGVAFDPEESEFAEDEVIQFGDFGYYDGWRDGEYMPL